jgi:hypothetical protein
MDENFENNIEESAENVEHEATEAGEQFEQAAENIGDHVEEAAEGAAEAVEGAWEQAGEALEDTLENVWEQGEEVVEDAGDEVESVWDEVTEVADEPSEVIESAWQPGEEVSDAQAFVMPEPNTDWSGRGEVTVESGDQFMRESSETWREHRHNHEGEFVPEQDEGLDPKARYDPRIAAEWGSTTRVAGAEIAGPQITPKDIQSIKADQFVEAEKKTADAVKEKKDFPVWAIVLIILLVLCICILIPVLLVFGGLFVLGDMISSFASFLPSQFL